MSSVFLFLLQKKKTKKQKLTRQAGRTWWVEGDRGPGVRGGGAEHQSALMRQSEAAVGSIINKVKEEVFVQQEGKNSRGGQGRAVVTLPFLCTLQLCLFFMHRSY